MFLNIYYQIQLYFKDTYLMFNPKQFCKMEQST